MGTLGVSSSYPANILGWMDAIEHALPIGPTGETFVIDPQQSIASDLIASLAGIPPGVVSIVVPLVLSVLAMAGLVKACGPVDRLLLLAWLLSLPAMYFASFWRETDGVLMLQILPIFSIAAMVMVWRKVDVPASLAYALSFFSLFAIDLVRAIEFANEHGIPLRGFMQGVGGAGITDGLFVFPALTAGFVVYGRWRHRTTRAAGRAAGARPVRVGAAG